MGYAVDDNMEAESMYCRYRKAGIIILYNRGITFAVPNLYLTK